MLSSKFIKNTCWDRRGRDHMVVGCRTTYAISANHHWRCGFESRSGRDVLDTTLCDKVCQWLATGPWFSHCPPVYSSNKTDCYDKNCNIVESGIKNHQTNNKHVYSISCCLGGGCLQLDNILLGLCQKG